VGAYFTGEIEESPVTLAPCIEPRKADVVQRVIVQGNQSATLTPDIKGPLEVRYQRSYRPKI